MPVGNPVTELSSAGNYVPIVRTLSINGTTYDLSADRSWTLSTLSSLIANAPLSFNSGTNTISISQSGNTTDGYLSSADWLTFSSKQPAITLTTTGNSGSSTLVGATLNVPTYTLIGLGGMSNPFTAAIGQLIYSNSAGAPLSLAPNTTTTKKYLAMTGDGTNGDVPFWDAISGFIGGSGTTNYIPKFTASGTIGNSIMAESSGLITIYGDGQLYKGQSGTGLTSFFITNDDNSFGNRHETKISTQALGSGLGRTIIQAASYTTNTSRGELSILTENGANYLSNIGTIITGGDNAFSLYSTSNVENIRLNTGGNSFLNGGNVGINQNTPTEKLDVVGNVRISNALAIGTAPDTNLPFKILKNINSTVGIRFENTNTSANAFSALQFGSDVTGGTAFTNFVYASSGITESGVFKPNGTSLVNTGSGGLNFLSVSQPIRFFTSSGNGTLRASITNDGDFTQFNGTNPSASTADAFRMYSADIVAGNAAPHFRTENGAVIKLYQETTSVGNAIFSAGGGTGVLDDSTFDGYTLRQIVKALRNQGILQ